MFGINTRVTIPYLQLVKNIKPPIKRKITPLSFMAEAKLGF